MVYLWTQARLPLATLSLAAGQYQQNVSRFLSGSSQSRDRWDVTVIDFYTCSAEWMKRLHKTSNSIITT